MFRHLCSFTHPDIAQVPDVPQQYRGIKALKEALKSHLQRHFCDVCLEGRKVWIDKHRRKFCHKWFYGENELWKHMADNHESCFLCKRSNPDRHVYYKDYEELEEHFRHEHYLCEDSICRQEHFQVWATEAELQQHRVRVHGDNMSRHEKRQAMRIPLDINFRRNDPEAPSSHPGGPPGTTIGGGGNVRSRFRLCEPNQRRDQNQIASAIQASMDSANAEAAHRDARQQALAQAATDRQAFNAADFPSVSGGPGGSGVMSGGRWAGGGGAAGGRITPEDFPALPGTSKSAKRRAKEKSKSMAERVGTQGQPRVINRGQSSRPHPATPSHPSTGSRPLPTQEASGATESSAAEETASDASYCADDQPEERSAPAARPQASMPSSSPMGQEAFPPLPQAAPAPRPRPPSGLQARPFLNPLAAKGPAKGKDKAAKAPSQAAPKLEDFPALGGRAAAVTAGPSTSQPSSAQPPTSGAASDGAAAAGTGVSDALKAANKAVIDKVRQRVSPEDFIQFKQQSALFMRGEASAQAFHSQVVALGLAALLPHLAALCPDALKRSDLLEAHRTAFINEGTAKGGGGWVPPEAAAAAVDQATLFSSWTCPACTLINAPQAFTCEACGSLRPSSSSAAAQDDRPTTSAAGHDDARQEADKGKKKGKTAKFERLRITGGDAVATQKWLDTAGGQRTKPQNVWTQQKPDKPSQWVKGNLTDRGRAVKNAWAEQ
ncbi:hypothetical protein ABBQ38_000883 [Trebouxia sp. C0009 RCD-2024]